MSEGSVDDGGPGVEETTRSGWKSLETPLQSQILERAEPVVAAIAAIGLRRWRLKPIDIEPLCALSLVVAELAAIGADQEIEFEARCEAVDAAIRAAIGRLPEPYSGAAHAQFGTDDGGEKPIPKEDRDEAAGKLLDRGGRWYRDVGRSEDYHGKTPGGYVVALVTRELDGITDPVSHLARSAAPKPAVELAPSQEDLPGGRSGRPRPSSSRRLTTLVASGLLAAALLLTAGLVAGWWSGGSKSKKQHSARKDSHQAAPVLRVNTDASCASFSANVQARKPSAEFVSSPGQLEGGEGGLAGKITPNGKYGQLLEVKKGEILELSIKLHDTDYGSISDVVTQVMTTYERPNCTRLTALTRSTSSPRDRAEQGPVILKSTAGGPARISYLPGSTVFLAQTGRRVAHLKDGVLAAGTAVPYQIPPSPPDYFVNFYVEVL